MFWGTTMFNFIDVVASSGLVSAPPE
jgi:hypothetical protein